MTSTTDQENSLPDEPWLVAHFRQFADDLKRLITLMHLHVNGIAAITAFPEVEAAIADLEKSRGIVRNTDSLERLRAEAALAQREVEEGFPVTHSQFLVDIWGVLEASARTLVARWLENVEGALQGEPFRRLKIRLGEYESRSGHARFLYVVQVLEREESSALKQGVDRFESMIASIGLSGAVPKRLKLALFELSQLRNCIVHNARRADEQLVGACPWLNQEVGQPLRLSPQQIAHLQRAALDYSLLVMSRATEARGKPITAVRDGVLKRWNEEEPDTA